MADVLVVEDDLSLCELLQETLEAAGNCVCRFARTAKEATEAFELYHPESAIVDVLLADGSLGIDFTVPSREIWKIKVIFSTGNDTLCDLTLREGDAVMTKPYLMKDLARALIIVNEMTQFGTTDLEFPPNFRLLEHRIL